MVILLFSGGRWNDGKVFRNAGFYQRYLLDGVTGDGKQKLV